MHACMLKARHTMSFGCLVELAQLGRACSTKALCCTFATSSKTMFSLTSWIGPCKALKVVSNGTCLQAFSALGGSHVGQMFLPETNESNVVETIKNLQRQASRLLPHVSRRKYLVRIYMVLVLDKTKLSCRDHMTKEETHLMLRCLQGATQNSRIELSWEEDDTVLKMMVLQYYMFNPSARYYTFGLKEPS